MDALLDYLDDIEEVLEQARSVPFSNRISVEKARIMEIISEIRLTLPDDIRNAQRILGDHDRIIAEANRKAQEILDAAENEAKLKVSTNEIYVRASEEAAEMMEVESARAMDLRMNATNYADEQLAEVEKQVREYMENIKQQNKRILDYFNKMLGVIYENRQQLRS